MTTTAALPASVTDHPAIPEWDTSEHSDLCDTCGWPVEKIAGRWMHEPVNNCWWADKRAADSLRAAITRKIGAMLHDYTPADLAAFAHQIGADQCNVCGGPTIVGDHTHPRFRDNQMGVSR